MPSNSFKQDYAKSRLVEMDFQLALASFNCFLIEDSGDKGQFYDWDVSITSTTTNAISTYEIKYQKQHIDNAVFLEMYQAVNGYQKPCGFTASKADYYVFKFENDLNFYLIKRIALLTLIEAKDYKKTFMDDNNYFMIIFQKENLIQHCFTL